jgi:hypothetical protein
MVILFQGAAGRACRARPAERNDFSIFSTTFQNAGQPVGVFTSSASIAFFASLAFLAFLASGTALRA